MELREVERLIEKYEEGSTSLAEEKQLKEYFNTHSVPSRLESYRIIFGYTTAARKETYQGKNPVGKKPGSKYAWIAIAASIVLALGLFVYQNNSAYKMENEHKDIVMTEEQEQTYQQARQTLLLVSEYMNEGKEELVHLKEINSANKFINLK
ncbi:hypothetical protein RM549_10675 [Salegentibacter sp. F188]|uniref:Uncharacterized protein n=1 Tax=Autumnicola patrickiae TaxID=3075591 RepID=A0ABU3E2U6_9FLAO|nr:hypothetical protein [Salegentibacter sp. F188]MDT0690250.1 hypothetical protein [Salegentibacter sp. F188]